MSKFVPESWKPKDKDIAWAIEQFKVEKKEVLRQTDLMRDHEFRRSYTDWNRVFRNWMRKCDEIGTFRREVRRKPDEYTEDMRQEDVEKWRENMERLGVSVVGAVKKINS